MTWTSIPCAICHEPIGNARKNLNKRRKMCHVSCLEEAKRRGPAPKQKTPLPAKPMRLPKGVIEARFAGTCPACDEPYEGGAWLMKIGPAWGHAKCAPDPRSIAFEKNKARILAGETFRGHKASDWRRGSSPGNSDHGR